MVEWKRLFSTHLEFISDSNIYCLQHKVLWRFPFFARLKMLHDSATSTEFHKRACPRLREVPPEGRNLTTNL